MGGEETQGCRRGHVKTEDWSDHRCPMDRNTRYRWQIVRSYEEERKDSLQIAVEGDGLTNTMILDLSLRTMDRGS